MEVARMRLKKEILIICFLYLSNALYADLRFDQRTQKWFSTNATKNIDSHEYNRLTVAFFEAANKGAQDSQLLTTLRINGSPEALLLIEDFLILVKKSNDDRMRLQNPDQADLQLVCKVIIYSSLILIGGCFIGMLAESIKRQQTPHYWDGTAYSK